MKKGGDFLTGFFFTFLIFFCLLFPLYGGMCQRVGVKDTNFLRFWRGNALVWNRHIIHDIVRCHVGAYNYTPLHIVFAVWVSKTPFILRFLRGVALMDNRHVMRDVVRDAVRRM